MPAPKYKIGFVLDDSLDKPDGVQQYVLGLGQWLASEGHDVHYIVSHTTRRDIAHVHSIGGNVRVKFNGNTVGTPLPVSRKKVRALLASEQFDVLHVQLPFSPFLAHKIIRNAPASTAVVGTFHILPISWLATQASRLLYLWTRSSWKRFDAVFSVSSAAQHFARSVYHTDSTILPNVIDVARFAGAQAYKRPTKTLLFLGRLVPRKGCQTLLAAVKLLRDDTTVPPFSVLICGKGELKEKLERFTRENKLDNVEFTGFVSEADKPRYYASADISVFPSRGGESFGIVLLEAMAAGKATVLAGDNPGYRAVMEPFPDQLFKPTDAVELAEKIKLYLLEDDQRRTVAGRQAHYAATFDTPLVGAELLNRYNKVLHGRRNLP